MARNTIAALVCLASCLLAAGARAELYQWTDEHGQVHVTDDATKVPTGKSITLDPQRSKARATRAPGARDAGHRDAPHARAGGRAGEAARDAVAAEPRRSARTCCTSSARATRSAST